MDLALGRDGSRCSNDVTRTQSLHFLALLFSVLVSFSGCHIPRGGMMPLTAPSSHFLVAYKLREGRNPIFFSVFQVAVCSPLIHLCTLIVQPESHPAVCREKQGRVCDSLTRNTGSGGTHVLKGK